MLHFVFCNECFIDNKSDLSLFLTYYFYWLLDEKGPGPVAKFEQ